MIPRLQDNKKHYQAIGDRHRLDFLAHAYVQLGVFEAAEEAVDEVLWDLLEKTGQNLDGTKMSLVVAKELRKRIALRAQAATIMFPLDERDRSALIRARDHGFDKAASMALCHALLRLDPEAREIWSLTYILKMDENVVADIIDRPIDVMRERLQYARVRLSDLITESQKVSKSNTTEDDSLPNDLALPTLSETLDE